MPVRTHEGAHAAPGHAAGPHYWDSKLGIGNAARQYVIDAFDCCGASAVTQSTFLGFASIAPYLEYRSRNAFLLCWPPNPDNDLRCHRLALADGQTQLCARIARLAQGACNLEAHLEMIIGAVYLTEIERVLAVAPMRPLLISVVGRAKRRCAGYRKGWLAAGCAHHLQLVAGDYLCFPGSRFFQCRAARMAQRMRCVEDRPALNAGVDS